MKRAIGVALVATLLGLARMHAGVAGAAASASEQQLKAVFVFNFTHFVAWPADSFAAPDAPFVIGVLGSDEFFEQLDRAVHGEQVDAHALVVRRYRGVEEIQDARILYVERSRSADLERALARASPRGTLTVSDADGAIGRGAMVQLSTRDNHIRLAINAEAARSADLVVSSNLLRLARDQGD